MTLTAIKKQTLGILQNLGENPFPIMLFVAYVTILSYFSQNLEITFWCSLFVLFIFTGLSEFILLAFGLACYILGALLFAINLDLREQLFLYSYVFFLLLLSTKIMRLLLVWTNATKNSNQSPIFPFPEYWSQEASLPLFLLAECLSETKQKPITPKFPKEEKAKPLTKDSAIQITPSIKSETFSQTQNKLNPNKPILDLSVQIKTTKPKFFDPPSSPLSNKFIFFTVVFFILINSVIFAQREKIVLKIGAWLGQIPTENISVKTPATPLQKNYLNNFASQQKDFENIAFQPENITPIFTLAVTPQPISISSEAAQTTQPPIISTEQPLAIKTSGKITVALENGSNVANAGRFVERTLERYNFYVKSIETGKSTNETVIYYKSGQKAYADQAVEVLNSLYTVTVVQSLPNSYFADLRILIGKRK